MDILNSSQVLGYNPEMKIGYKVVKKEETLFLEQLADITERQEESRKMASI